MSYGPPRVPGHPLPGEKLTQEIVRRLFDYDPKTGALIWRQSYPRFIGRRAGSIDKNRRYVCIARKLYRSSRIIWLYVYGVTPDCDVDHKDLDPLNDRIDNLRLATRAQNAANKRKYSSNKTGFKGVSKKGPNSWAATIGHRGRTIHLGYFGSPEAASARYIEAALSLNGEFANY